jgi:hypothetical protein
MRVHHTFINIASEDINFLTNLHRNIYDAALSSDYPPLSRGLILQFKNQILAWSPIEFLTELFSCNFDTRYTLKFLLAFPELWTNFKLADWLTVITNTKRIIPRPLGAYEGCFADIQFLCRHLSINGFQLLMLSEADVKSKKNIITYFWMHAFILNPDFERSALFTNVAENVPILLETYKDDFLKSNPNLNTFKFEKEKTLSELKPIWKKFRDA